MKTLYFFVGFMLIALTIGYFYLISQRIEVPTKQVLTFEDCAKAGYIVMESYPRQCRTPDGRVFAEEIKQQAVYSNSTQDLIQVELPYPGAVVGKKFTIVGKARGRWYFEASFPVNVIGKDGVVLFQAPAQAQSDWMTENLVPFKLEVTIPDDYIGPATIVLKNDNPSGDPAKDASVTIPINIEY